MSRQERVFGPLLERTMENAQVRHLAEQYDLSRDSNLARAIVRHTNSMLDTEEKRRQIDRVRPGELLLRTRRGPLVLPLCATEDVARVVSGERWEIVRRDIPARCESRYRQLFPDATPMAVERFLHCLWQGRGPQSERPSSLHGPRKQRPWGSIAIDGAPLAQLDAERARLWVERDPPRPAHQPETLQKLAHFLGTQAGVPPAIQEPMMLDLVATRARFCPRITTLATGQMPLVAMHLESGRTLWQATRHQPMAPVVIGLLAEDEARLLRHHPFTQYEQFMEFYGRRMARVLVETYKQNGLLSYAELQWIFLASSGTVSRALDHYQRQRHVILPCPGTVLDMGRMLTHKRLVVQLHLQGLSVLDISRRTYHNPGPSILT